jgi:hypothetical protein
MATWSTLSTIIAVTTHANPRAELRVLPKNMRARIASDIGIALGAVPGREPFHLLSMDAQVELLLRTLPTIRPGALYTSDYAALSGYRQFRWTVETQEQCLFMLPSESHRASTDAPSSYYVALDKAEANGHLLWYRRSSRVANRVAWLADRLETFRIYPQRELVPDVWPMVLRDSYYAVAERIIEEIRTFFRNSSRIASRAYIPCVSYNPADDEPKGSVR